ncbi:MAG: hypothetical protein ACRCT9_07020 [Roseinatronobacter monicus]
MRTLQASTKQPAGQALSRSMLANRTCRAISGLQGYPFGEGRRGSSLTVAFYGEHLDESFYTERGGCEDLDLFSAIDPDDTIFWLNADGEIMEAIDGFDGVDLFQLHGQAA